MNQMNSWIAVAIPAAATVGYASFYTVYFVLPNHFPKLRQNRSLGRHSVLCASALSLLTVLFCRVI
jgi:uncharacterized BrkB/YihY/UPF0761 family membrane protein